MRILASIGVAVAVPIICVIVLVLMYVSYLLAIAAAVVLAGFLAYMAIPCLSKTKNPPLER